MILLIAVLVLVLLHFNLRGQVRALQMRLEEEGLPVRPTQLAEPSVPPPAEAQPAAAPAEPERSRAKPPSAARETFTAETVDAHIEAESPPGPSLGALFERFVGGRLLIWIGGIALAVAGVFLVRFSAGLITPGIRMILAGLFGLVLLAGGELARSRPGALPDPRVPQALVGAGILVLYAAPYGAWILYHLISTGTASTLMVMVTAAALVLSLRHGAPAAVLGLVGGFATPLLVADANAGAIPLLSYLALLDIALFALASRRGWTWLAASAVLLSLVWSGILLGQPPDDALAAGLFVVLISVAGSLLRAGPGWQLDFIRPAALGLLELAVLVARVDLGLPAWFLFGALSLASFLLATRRADYRPIPAFALLLALMLLAVKADLGKELLPQAGGVTLLFASAAIPLALRRPEKLLWSAVASIAFAGPILILRLQQPGMVPASWYGIAELLLALGPLLLAWRLYRDEQEAPILVASACGLLLAAVGLSDLLPVDLVPAAWLALALPVALLAGRAGPARLAWLGLFVAGAALALAALRVSALWLAILLSLGGVPPLAADLPGSATAFQALALPGFLLLLLLRLLPADRRSAWLLGAALFCVTASLYLLFKQAWGLRSAEDFVARGFAERTLFTQALFLAGWLFCRIPMPGLEPGQRRTIGIAFTAVAAARLLWFDLLVDNPVAVVQAVGPVPVLNWLAPAFLVSAAWLYAARRGAGNPLRSGIWLALFLLALIAGVMLLVRQGFQGSLLTAPVIPAEESYAYSLAALLLSLGLLLSGVRMPDKALRVAGLGLLTATTLKVFLVDASALEGLLRILSFLALGVALIGIGKLYTRVLDAERGTATKEGNG